MARNGGAVPKRVAADEYAGPCPVCDGRDRFSINTKKQVFNCRGCGSKGDVIALVQFLDGIDFRTAVERLVLGGCGRALGAHGRHPTASPAKAVSNSTVAREIAFRERIVAAAVAEIVCGLGPVADSPFAMAYLELRRKIKTAAIRDVLERTDAIGWHPSVKFNAPEPEDPCHQFHGQRLGCIVGIMTDAMTTKPTGAISRTYLDHDGCKVGKAKTLGSPAGIVRLSADDEVTTGLFIAEGIETALTGMANFGLRPMWSTGSSSLMAKFPALSGIETLNVVVDRDPNAAGERAAHEVEARWLAAGAQVNLLVPDGVGDLNDALIRAKSKSKLGAKPSSSTREPPE